MNSEAVADRVDGEQARVLLVGVGTGEEILRLAPNNPGWRFTAEDPSGAMLAVAKEKIASAGLADRVDLVEGLVQDLPSAEPYDAATLILVQHFLPDDGRSWRFCEQSRNG